MLLVRGEEHDRGGLLLRLRHASDIAHVRAENRRAWALPSMSGIIPVAVPPGAMALVRMPWLRYITARVVCARTVWRYFPSNEACARPLFTAGIDIFATRLREWAPGQPLEDIFAPELTADLGVVAGPDRATGGALVRLPAPSRTCAPSGCRATKRRSRLSLAPSPSAPGCRPTARDPGGDVQRGPARGRRALRLAHRRREARPCDGGGRADGNHALGPHRRRGGTPPAGVRPCGRCTPPPLPLPRRRGPRPWPP